jgi:1,4-dihydroxy-2-naphthoate octaprenyltransferase
MLAKLSNCGIVLLTTDNNRAENFQKVSIIMEKQGLKRFFDFVEIQTKLATVIPSLAGLAYTFYAFGTINIRSMIIYFIAALFLDMSVTAINNHMDTREDSSQTPHYSTKKSWFLIFAMLLVFGVLGLFLAYLHGATVFLAGALCLVIGVCYTFGPAPISKSPFSEVAAGFVTGTMVMFIVVSINSEIFQPLGLSFDLAEKRLMMDIDLVWLFSFVLITLPVALCTANILLANNICDAEKDRQFRYTLVHHIGLRHALSLFVGLYFFCYLSIVTAVLIGLLPVWCLLTLITLFPVRKNIKRFLKEQKKNITFALSIKNFMLIALVYTFGLIIGGILNIL